MILLTSTSGGCPMANEMHRRSPMHLAIRRNERRSRSWLRCWLVSVEFRKCYLGGIGSAHAVCAGARRGGRRAEVHARNTNLIGRQGDSRSERELADVLGAGHDVAVDEIWVVSGHLGGGAHRFPDDPVAEA